MNIAELATVRVQEYSRELVLRQAEAAAIRIAATSVDDLVAAHDAAWLLAASLVQQRLNGVLRPRIFTRTLDDGVKTSDGIG